MNCNCLMKTDRHCNLIIDSNFVEEYVQVFIITNSDESYKDTIIKEDKDTPVQFYLPKDGLYLIRKASVPTSESNSYYYKDGIFYHNLTEISLEELLEINPEVSNIEIEDFFYFSTCNLKKCFISVCQEIFKNTSSICKTNINNHELIYKRDLIWSIINVIKYMVDLEQFEEAERLLEEAMACNGLCPQNTNNDCGCGCGK